MGASEESLLERLRQAVDPEEKRLLLGRLLGPYLARISRWALRLRGDPQAAADLAQDALTAVCTHIHSFRGESRFSTWIFTILRNQASRSYAQQQRRLELPLEHQPEPRSPAAGPAEILGHQNRLQEAGRLLRTVLTPLEARIFLLHYGQDVPLAVLDARLGLTNRSGSKAYIVAARRKLKRALERSAARSSRIRLASSQVHRHD